MLQNLCNVNVRGSFHTSAKMNKSSVWAHSLPSTTTQLLPFHWNTCSNYVQDCWGAIHIFYCNLLCFIQFSGLTCGYATPGLCVCVCVAGAEENRKWPKCRWVLGGELKHVDSEFLNCSDARELLVSVFNICRVWESCHFCTTLP